MKFQYKSVIYVFALIGIVGTSDVYSQRLLGELDFQIGLPQGNYKAQIDNQKGYGVGLRFGYRISDSPFMVGIDFGFMNFGTESREESLSPTIPELRVEVENTYNLFHGHLLFRLIPGQMAIKPYLDGLFGFNHFSTETILRQRSGIGAGEEILRDTNFKDTALSYGLGAGIQFNVYSGNVKGDDGTDFPFTIGINMMTRYLIGYEAEYLRPGSIIRENGSVTYDVMKSTTDILYFKVGLVVLF